MIHFSGGTKLDGTGFHYATQNGVQFKTYCLFLEFSIIIFRLQLTVRN